MWGKNHPIHHFLVVGCLHPTLLHFPLCQLVEDMLVFLCDLLHVSLFRLLEVRCNHVEVGSVEIIMTLCKDLLFIIEHLQTSEVGPILCQLFEFSLPIDGIEIFRSVPNTYEINHCILGVAPTEVIYVRVKRFRDVFLISRLQVVHAKTITVALITIAFHRQPCYVLAIRWELRILVVARIVLQVISRIYRLVFHGLWEVYLRLFVVSGLTKILCFSRFGIVKENVGISRNRILYSFFFATSVSNITWILAPV